MPITILLARQNISVFRRTGETSGGGWGECSGAHPDPHRYRQGRGGGGSHGGTSSVAW